jgi:hypothetical protein
MINKLVSITTTFRHRMLEIQMQLKGKEILILTEKIDRLERSSSLDKITPATCTLIIA